MGRYYTLPFCADVKAEIPLFDLVFSALRLRAFCPGHLGAAISIAVLILALVPLIMAMFVGKCYRIYYVSVLN